MKRGPSGGPPVSSQPTKILRKDPPAPAAPQKPAEPKAKPKPSGPVVKPRQEPPKGPTKSAMLEFLAKSKQLLVSYAEKAMNNSCAYSKGCFTHRGLGRSGSVLKFGGEEVT